MKTIFLKWRFIVLCIKLVNQLGVSAIKAGVVRIVVSSLAQIAAVVMVGVYNRKCTVIIVNGN